MPPVQRSRLYICPQRPFAAPMLYPTFPHFVQKVIGFFRFAICRRFYAFDASDSITSASMAGFGGVLPSATHVGPRPGSMPCS
jgi:hypothetical protein